MIHFDHKAIFMLSLPLLPGDVDVYKTCVRQRNPALNVDLKPLDDVRTFFTTEHPPREHYLPLPIQVSIIACLLVLSALFSGLTLGLMSLTPMELELVEKSGSPTEQSYASAILPVRRKGNLLLCALLLGNVIVNSAISILFGDLTSGFLALFISSAGIVVFGEIIPQSICVKKGLAIGANTILITRLFILMTFPLAWPISKLLDYLLGDEYVAYDRKRLMELIKLSVRDDTSGLADELKIAVGAMEIADKVVKDVMTKITDVFMLPDTTVLNTKNIAEIVRMGYTRIPVYAHGHKNTVTDILFVKDLALIDPDDNFTIKTVCGYHKHPVKFVDSDAPLRGVLEEFKKGDAHLAMVRQLAPDSGGDPLYELVGIVTLEDIVEEILQAEIVDEFDVITDNVNRIKRINYQNRDLSKFFEKETAETQISMQIQLVAEQWLVANEPAFDESLIDRGVLQRLIRTCARHVDVSSLMALSGGEPVVVPRIAKFYTKGELSDRFILILEGRATVTIGKGELNFEAGPWHSFGGEVMKKLLANAKNLARSSSIADAGELNAIRRPDLAFVPDYSITVPDECTFLEITTTTYINAYRATLMQREIGYETLGVPMEVPCLLDDQTEGELNDESGRPTELETIPLENIDSSPIAPQSPHDAASPLSRRSKSESDGEEV
ncbi:unnamed protein product [Anisakis simplex]|uniref:CNNM transmembrane domain-containing protein n=1 Tax=Anisakis simplex TaxID=6269 RepID=A0A3P6QYB8_ANISI|nr:unnamed protein product [Anisakis simplex]